MHLGDEKIIPARYIGVLDFFHIYVFYVVTCVTLHGEKAMP